MSSYGGIQDKLKKRRVEIMIDFPQVVSELALLTSSGMEIYNAWAKVAGERDGELYREMRHTSKEVMEYGVDPSAAFEMFIRRCGTKETARLGTSILQSIKRSPEELSNFLIGLSQEAWDDRKHNARRMGAAAQSKLLIPMMLIFLGIIFLVMAPVVMEMGNMGF
jgi:tight adherence protein C